MTTDQRALVLKLREYAHDEDSAVVTLAERAADALDEHAKEIVAMHEEIAALQSREVCTAAHDNVDECGYCQRDRQQQIIERYRTALEKIASSKWGYASDCWDIARSALSGAP